ncbi:MAG: rRNA pseudouridine synthase [Candidatus Omnitrophica bacterium]|nr:rRNA pseudouridine synthase [Candidatus Omnitrophota bacterium]
MTREEKGTRLQVVLARYGLASRRGVVSMIEQGKVRVNGVVVREKGFRVDLPKDKIDVEGQALALPESSEKRYFLLNKPKGVMTTMQDPHAEKTVADFFHDIPERLFPVGRLDRDTTGLLLMTNDGELTFRLTHPKYGVPKTYRVKVEGLVTEAEAKRLEKGVHLEDGKTAPCRIQIDEKSQRDTQLTITIHEGKKRQIRRVFQTMGHWVTELERLSYGPLRLGALRYGERRELGPGEVRALMEMTGLMKAPKRSR